MLYDFHTHTFLSDGALAPIELIRRAFVKGYSAIGLTDHVGVGSISRVIKETSEDCALARTHWSIIAIPGIELTHIPPQAISESAQRAKDSGARLVIVHGESTAEPVEKGTNLAAVQSCHVDILAHPGFITLEEATLAAQNDIFIELTARKGHSSTNSHVALISQQAHAKLILSSDAHDDTDLLTPALAETILYHAGLNPQQQRQVLKENPLLLLEKIG